MIRQSCLVLGIVATIVVAGSIACAQQSQPADPQKSKHDSMESMNERGDKVMGFDHDKTTHHFLLRSNGGVIQIEANEKTDTASRDEIRQHMRHIAMMFAEGNFSAPVLIHEQNPPGVDVMKQFKSEIKYEFVENERGAFIRISTGNTAAVKAIHDFLRFQIREHMTGDPLEPKP